MTDPQWCSPELPCATATALREQLAEAREALREYGRHTMECHMAIQPEGECICGFDAFAAALAKLDARP